MIGTFLDRSQAISARLACDLTQLIGLNVTTISKNTECSKLSVMLFHFIIHGATWCIGRILDK